MSAERPDQVGPLRALRHDLVANRGNSKAQFVLLLFRIAQAARGSGSRPRPVAVPYLVLYRVLVEWVLGIELPWKTRVGPGLRIHHGQGLVVNSGTVLGRGVTLRQSTTIGDRRAPGWPSSGCPVIGEGVDIGPGCVVLGPITIGNDAVIGAGSVVLHDVPERAVVAGNPARVIRTVEKEAPA